MNGTSSLLGGRFNGRELEPEREKIGCSLSGHLVKHVAWMPAKRSLVLTRLAYILHLYRGSGSAPLTKVVFLVGGYSVEV